jgi:tetratricopeptide (TPR) repeat protein
MQMKSLGALVFAAFLVTGSAWAQQEETPVHINPRVPEKAPKRSTQTAPDPTATEKPEETAGPISPGESSSRDTKINLEPPRDESKSYPDSDVPSDVQETHPFNPHKAQKDLEVGDFYFKRKNYRGALARYQSALVWQDNNAEAMFKLAQCAEKLGDKDTAAKYYSRYIDTLPHGERVADARKGLGRLGEQ